MSKRSTSKASRTDWKRLERMRDEDINLSDIPEATAEQFAKAIVRKNFKPIPRPKKALLSFRIDPDVLAWFRAKGPGYQSRMNALLRAYMEAHKR